MGDRALKPDFYARGTLEVARDLLGCVVEVGQGEALTSGRIVETEAYLGEQDPASHAGRGPTPRSSIMFGPPGVVYVFLIYGMHHCLNFVTEPEGTAGAVLIRGLEPIEGRSLMILRRGLDPRKCHDQDLTAGPGKLCRALGIDRTWNGKSLADSSSGIRVFPARKQPLNIVAGPRVGIRHAQDLPYRFQDARSHCLTD